MADLRCRNDLSPLTLNTLSKMFSFNCRSFFNYFPCCHPAHGYVGCIITVVIMCDYFILIARTLALYVMFCQAHTALY